MKKRQFITLGILIAITATACGNVPVDRVEPIIENITETDNSPVENYDAGDAESADDATNGSISGNGEAGASISKEDTVDTEEDTLSIIMVGDMLLHDRIEDVSKKEDGTYDYAAIFEHTRDLIAEADIAIANEEVIIGGSELGVSGYPAFNAPYEFADELVDVGFDVVCQGTNHALDKGGKGIINCLGNWEDKYPDIAVLGIHDSAEDQNEVYICEKNGIRLAILNYTYGTNGISLPSDMPYGVDYISEEKVLSDLAYAEENADFTIVCPHWGTEYSLKPDNYQTKWAGIFTENGADLIIGTHPHVIEGVDWISRGENDKAALCYYSLGNFVNWTSGTGAGVSNRMLGAMARVKIKRSEDGRVVIDSFDAVPLVSHVTYAEDGVTVYPLSEYTDELAKQNEIISQAGDFSLEYCRNLADEILGDVVK